MNRKTDRRPDSELQDDLVMIGEVVKPHGIRGEVKVNLFSGQPENFKNYKNIFLRKSAEQRPETHKVIRSREQGRLVIIQLQGIETRNDAEALLGSSVWLDKADFPELDSDEYYWHQLEGLAVETESGRILGRVSRLFNTPAHDVMVVSGAGREIMVPVKDYIIRSIDRQAGKIIISPPPGLLEMNR